MSAPTVTATGPSQNWVCLMKDSAHRGFKLRVCLFLAITLFFAAASAWPEDPQHENSAGSLGLLLVTGGVEVNGASVTAEIPLFTGDSITTRADGNATLKIPGRGEFNIAPMTQIILASDPRYVAQVTRGTVTLHSLAAHSDLAVRTGDYIVTVPASARSQSAATVQRQNDGSGLVSCTVGTIQILAMEGDTSIPLAAGQATSLAPQANQTIAARVPAEQSDDKPAKAHKTHHLRTALIIAGTGGTAGIFYALHH
jgi:hypothetical protein